MWRMMEGRSRVLWALIAASTLVLSSGASVAAVENDAPPTDTGELVTPPVGSPNTSNDLVPSESPIPMDDATGIETIDPSAEPPTPEGVIDEPGPVTSSSEIPEEVARGSQENTQAAPLKVVLSLDASRVGVGEPLTANWQITGGNNPKVTDLKFVTEITDGPMLFTSGSRAPSTSSFGLVGSATTTVANSGNRILFDMWVTDSGKTVRYRSDRVTVAGFSGKTTGGWGTVTDSRTGEEGTGYYSGGALLKGWFVVAQEWFYTNTKGFVQYNWVRVNGTWYYFMDRGQMATGWLRQAGSWYYLDPGSGAMKTGWVTRGGEWYYLNPSAGGVMATGWAKIRGTWYYLDPSSGAMATGWRKVGSRWYYLTSSGAMATGWMRIGNAWYYLELNSGAMATGWLRLADTWYYLNPSGAMATGWVKSDGTWYYLEPTSGALQAGASSLVVLVNKRNPLDPITYVPALVPLARVGVGGGELMRPEAANAMGRMVSAARSSGIQMQVGSGYRSYWTQASLFASYVARDGLVEAETYSARAGYSEHQTGLAADMSSPNEGCYLHTCFGNTKAGQWIAANSWRYGFIVRYPRGYTHITGFIWEPWHVRYVGVEVATAMHNRGIPTYEQYMDSPAAPTY